MLAPFPKLQWCWEPSALPSAGTGPRGGWLDLRWHLTFSGRLEPWNWAAHPKGFALPLSTCWSVRTLRGFGSISLFSWCQWKGAPCCWTRSGCTHAWIPSMCSALGTWLVHHLQFWPKPQTPPQRLGSHFLCFSHHLGKFISPNPQPNV